jgi:hypothetical protein
MSDRPNRTGYKNPPMATRFKPGVSGNPSGRPKRKPSLLDELAAALAAPIATNATTTNAHAIADALVGMAAAGNIRAITALIDVCVKRLSATDPHEDAAVPADADLVNEFVDREIRRRSIDGSKHPSEQPDTFPDIKE